MPPLVLNPPGAITHIFSQNVLSICQAIIFNRGTEKEEVQERVQKGVQKGIQMGENSQAQIKLE